MDVLGIDHVAPGYWRRVQLDGRDERPRYLPRDEREASR